MNKTVFFLCCFLFPFISCKNEKHIDIIDDYIQNKKIETVLPQEIDSLNVFFTRNRFDYYMLHINKSEYLLLDLNNKKTYNVNIMKDSLDHYLVDLFIDEKTPAIIERVKDGKIRYTDYNSMSVSVYYNNRPNKFFDIDFGDEFTQVKFSDALGSLDSNLYFITYSPENIEERLKTIEHFRGRTEKK